MTLLQTRQFLLIGPSCRFPEEKRRLISNPASELALLRSPLLLMLGESIFPPTKPLQHALGSACRYLPSTQAQEQTQNLFCP